MPDHGDRRSRLRLASILGVVAFIIVNVAVHLDRCSLGNGISCNQDQGQATGWVLLIAAVLAIASAWSPLGRGFAKGFVAGFIGLTVLTAGTCTFAWRDPVYSLEQATAPARRGIKRAWVRRQARRAWITAMNTRPPDIERGVALAAEVARCAFWNASPGPGPRSEQEVLRSCNRLETTYMGFDTVSPPIRYVVPQPGSPDTALFVRDAVSGDPGWRWSLVLPAGGVGAMALVEPDSGLANHWPRITASSDDNIAVVPREGAEPTPVEPVAELRTLAQCLKGIPAELDSRPGYAWGTWHLFSMVGRLCPGLADRVSDMPIHYRDMLLSLRRPLASGEAPVAIGTYRVSFENFVEPGTSYRFSLVALPVTGLKGYTVGEDGVIRDSVLHR